MDTFTYKVVTHMLTMRTSTIAMDKPAAAPMIIPVG